MYLYFYSWSAKEEEELKWTLSAACVFTPWWQVILQSASFPSSVTMIDILISLTRICSLTSVWYLESAQYLFVFTFGWQVIGDWASVPVVTMIDNLKKEDFGVWIFRFCPLLSVVISFGFVFVCVYVSCLVRTGVLAAHVRAVESRKAEPALCR